MQMLHVFTYGAGDIRRFEYLKGSADFCGLHINYITQTVWNGFFDKVKFTLNAIRGLPDDDIVCFVDGFDVLAVCGSADEITSKFKSYNCEILFGAELNCWPGEYKGRYPAMNYIKGGYRYLNSGGFIGYKRAIMALYTWKTLEEIAHICKTCGGDQGYFIEYFLANYTEGCGLMLDWKALVFQNMFSVDWNEIHIEEGRVVNSLLETKPCFLHFNGDSWRTKHGGDIMPVFIEKLNYSATNSGIIKFAEFTQNFSEWYFKRSQVAPY